MVPAVLQSDNGSEFCAKTTEALCTLYGVLYCVTPVCILKKKHRARHS